MSTNSEQEKALGKIASALRFENEEDALEFRAEAMHLRFIEKIKGRMRELGINQTRIAEELGTSKGYVSQLFSGDRLLNLKTLAKLETILDIKIELQIAALSDSETHSDAPSFNRVAEPGTKYNTDNPKDKSN